MKETQKQEYVSLPYFGINKLFPYLKPYRRIIISMVLLCLLAGIIDIVIPLFQRYSLNHFIALGTLDSLPGFIIAYVFILLMQVAGNTVSSYQAGQIEMYVSRDMRRESFNHLQTLSFSYFNQNSVGYIHARVMSDTLRIASLVAWGLVDMFWALLYVVSVFVIMFVLNIRLALILVLVVPCIAVITAFFQNRILKWNRKVRRINSQITSAYNEGITGVKTSKSMVIEGDNEKDFFERSSEMKHAAGRAAKLNAVYIPTILFFGSAAAAYVLYRGGHMVQSEIMQLGTLSVFISYAVIIFEPIQQLARLLAELISCQANIERVMDLLEQEPNVTDREDVIRRYGDNFEPRRENWEKIRGDIVFEDVSFMYPDGKEYVLEHFNLHIPAGMNVAIVGETGAGKSTLVNLAGRFFEPTEGRILIDGVDYRERSQLWLHSQIGYVLQNPHLFSGTVRENIRYGRLSATDEEIEAAARSVSADAVVRKLPDGYDSDVGESGGRLSVGEKQLISFARAILADPAIFVLDEATSSIDTATEQLIQKATQRLLQGHTSFVIAHRLSTIRNADLILVVKDGRVIEQGSHQELLQQEGYYRDLYDKQFEEESAMRVFEENQEK